MALLAEKYERWLVGRRWWSHLLKNGISQKLDDLLSAKSVEARFVKGAFWSLAGTVIAQMLRMVAAIVTVRLLGRVHYGQLGMVYSTVETLGIFAGVGLGLTAIKHVAEFRTTDPARAGRILGLSFFVAIASGSVVTFLAFVSAPMIVSRFLNAPDLLVEFRLACFLLFLHTILGLQGGALAGFEAFRAVSRVNLIRGLLNFPILIFSVWRFGLLGAILAETLICSICLGLNHVALMRECLKANMAISLRGCSSDFHVLWKFSLPALLNSILVAPVIWLCNTILVNQPDGYGQMGLLGVGHQWRTFLMFLPSIFMHVTLPILSSSSRASKKEDHDRILLLTQGLSMNAVIPAGVLLMFGADLLMKLYGDAFTEGDIVLIGTVATVMIQSVGAAGGPMIQSQGKMWFGFVQNLSWGVLLVAVVWFFGPSQGAKALAFGSALSYVVLTTWTYIYLSKDLPEGFLKRIFTSELFLLLTTALCILMPGKYRIFFSIPMALLAVYVTLFLLTPPEFRQQATRFASRLLALRSFRFSRGFSKT